MKQHVLEALVSQGPHPSLGAHADTYGRLIGGWRGELQSHLPGHSAPPASLEIHFGWALEGRAVQDVWITPARDQRAVGVTASLPPLDWYGTTVRVFDPNTKTRRRHRAGGASPGPADPLDVHRDPPAVLCLARSHPRAGREDLALGGRDPRPPRERGQ